MKMCRFIVIVGLWPPPKLKTYDNRIIVKENICGVWWCFENRVIQFCLHIHRFKLWAIYKTQFKGYMILNVCSIWKIHSHKRKIYRIFYLVFLFFLIRCCYLWRKSTKFIFFFNVNFPKRMVTYRTFNVKIGRFLVPYNS